MDRNAEYKQSIAQGVADVFGYFAAVKVVGDCVTVSCDTYGDGISFKQIMDLRNVFDAEFNIEHEHTDGSRSEAGTWWPGERRIIFTFKRAA